jgi:hypothetical protein
MTLPLPLSQFGRVELVPAATVEVVLMRPAKVPEDVRDCKSRDKYEEEDDVEEVDLDDADASANRPPCMELSAPILLLPFMLMLVLRGRRCTSLMVHIMAEQNAFL